MYKDPRLVIWKAAYSSHWNTNVRKEFPVVSGAVCDPLSSPSPIRRGRGATAYFLEGIQQYCVERFSLDSDTIIIFFYFFIINLLTFGILTEL